MVIYIIYIQCLFTGLPSPGTPRYRKTRAGPMVPPTSVYTSVRAKQTMHYFILQIPSSLFPISHYDRRYK